MISTPHGEYENDGTPVVKERLTGERVGGDDKLLNVWGVPMRVKSEKPMGGGLTSMELEAVNPPPAPAATHPPQSGTMYKGG